jgi:gamma-glutamyltranspeptidase
LKASAKAYDKARVAPRLSGGDAAVVAGDREGSVVACNFTMGRRFGLGRVAGGAGILLAAAEATENAFLAPMLVANENVTQGYLAIASSGGSGGPLATALVALHLLEQGPEIDAALAAPRALRLGPGGPDFVEKGFRTSGGNAELVDAIGEAQVVWCSGGLVRAPKSCRFAADRRGWGLAQGQKY